jgi:hypothetical protein
MVASGEIGVFGFREHFYSRRRTDDEMKHSSNTKAKTS